MAVAGSAERHFGVVEVEHVDAVEADVLRGLVQEVVDALLRVDFVAGGPSVRRVETDAELWVIEGFYEAAEFFERPAAERAGACGVFHDEINAGSDVFKRLL